MTVRFLLAYDGTRYAGWQRQHHAPTIQATLEDALRNITGHRTVVLGAGRTDAGVHAWGQVAHARLTTRLTVRTLQNALNAVLPPDIVVRRVTRVPNRFHARYDAVRKRYRYRIAVGPLKPLFTRDWVHWVAQPLNVAAMRRVAKAWVGRHDFGAFHSAGRPVASTRRTVYALRIIRRAPLDHGLTGRGGELHVEIEADGFLYHMVRRMVGVLLEIGKGKPRPIAAPTAPAKGLCLLEVKYR